MTGTLHAGDAVALEAQSDLTTAFRRENYPGTRLWISGTVDGHLFPPGFQCGIGHHERTRPVAECGAGAAPVLFSAVRELLVNTATHAGAREARVWISSEDGMCASPAADDGAGFDATVVSLQGYGLFGISEQLRHVGGRMHIDSGPGRGEPSIFLGGAPFRGL